MPVDHSSGPQYAVPFFRGKDLWQGFWMYTHNLKTADRFDWENTEDLLKDYFEKRMGMDIYVAVDKDNFVVEEDK